MNRTILRPSFFVLLGLCGNAAADEYHYNNVLIGDRANGLGGAYTAISDEPAGLYYNPAGTVYAAGRSLSASVNAYHQTWRTYKNVLGGGDWTRESANLLPNFFGVLQPLGKGVVGFSYAVTDSVLENQDQRLANLPGITEYVINVNNQDNTYKLGPSYARELGDGLSVGVTLYFHFRNSETIVSQTITRTDASYEWQASYVQSDEFGVEPVVGLMWTPTDKWAVGLTVRGLSVLSSSIDTQSTCASDIPVSACPSATPTSTFANSDLKRAYPLTLTLGIAHFPSSKLLYSADFSYYDEARGEADEHHDDLLRTKVATWNASAGMEYYLSDRWAMRAGLFTDRANTPVLSSSRTNQPEHIDIYGFSLSMSRFTRNSALTLGMAYGFGDGEAQVISDFNEIQDATARNLTIFLSTAYSF